MELKRRRASHSPAPASVAAPAAERRLFFVIIAVVIVVTPVLPLPFLLELVPVPVHQDSFIWPEKLLRTGACGAHRHGPGIASPFGGGQIHPGAGGIPSVPGLPAKWIQSLQNIGHPAQRSSSFSFFFQERDFRRLMTKSTRIVPLPPVKAFSFSFAGGRGVCYKKGCGCSNLQTHQNVYYGKRPIRFFMHQRLSFLP